MNRKNFIKKISLGLAGGIMATSFIGSNSLTTERREFHQFKNDKWNVIDKKDIKAHNKCRVFENNGDKVRLFSHNTKTSNLYEGIPKVRMENGDIIFVPII